MSGSAGSDGSVLSMENVSVEFTESKNVLHSLFGEPDTVHAVDDVSLDIDAGEVIALIGESGCGKTTLGKAAIGLQRPTRGTVSYRGQDIWAAKDGVGDVSIPYGEIRRSLQIIHQDPGGALNPYQTVEKTLSLPLKRWHDDLDANDRRVRIKSMLDYVGMKPADEYLHRYPHQLSGGEQQRVALIRTLLVNPDLVLADEAVSALDVSLRVDMMDLMLELREHFDTAYLFISHDLANARYLAGKAGGRIGVMYLGEIVEIGPVDQIIDNPRHPYTRALHWAAATIDPDDTVSDPPIRRIDIPDPVDLPSGCRFHTRCPEARAVCEERAPSLAGRDVQAACFREYDDDHEYWRSEPIDDALMTSD